MGQELDDVDRGILYLLQLDARNTTSQDIADKVGVSASTVRNRIEQLEDSDVIQNYVPEIDYEAADLPLHVVIVVTAPPTERGEYVDRLLDVQGVVDVREMLTAENNIHAEVVGSSTEDITRVTSKIHDLGLKVESSEMVKKRRRQPFNHFYFSEDLGDGE